MKKLKNLILSLILILVSVVFIGGMTESKNLVFATDQSLENPEQDTEGGEDLQDPTQEEIEQEIIDKYLVGYALDVRTDIEDPRLYDALLQEINKQIRQEYGTNIKLNTLYDKMFRNTKELSIREMNISSLKGLEHFKFDSLETLKINANNIQSVDKEIFEYMPKLTTLDLACNNIQSIDLTLATNNLKNINLSSNQLTTLDASKLLTTLDSVYIGDKNISINLADNNFSSIKDIALPTRIDSIELNIISNNIKDITQEYFDYSKLKMNIGIQGLKGNEVVFDTKDSLSFYKLGNAGDMQNIELRIYKDGLDQVLVKTLTDNFEGNYLEIDDLTVGDYFIEYWQNGAKLYKKNDPTADYFKTYKFSVVPTRPMLKFEYKGKIYDTFDQKVTGKVKVIIEAEEGAEIYYSLNGSAWTLGNEVMCDGGGNYSVSAKAVLDGVESFEETVVIRTSLNTVIPDVVMFVLILLLTLSICLVVIPFINKKLMRR